jgi:molybdopterin converting factor small subunit
MPILRVPALLKYYLNDQTEVTLTGMTVAEVLGDLIKRYPVIQSHLYDSSGKVRRHINLFVNQDNIRDLNGLETPVSESDVVKVLPSVTGGRN